MTVTTNPEHMDRETTSDLFRSSVRREIVAILHESGSIGHDRLTETLAMSEADADEDARRQIRIALYHNHLPRLAEAELVVYDDETVTPTNRLQAVASKVAHFGEGTETLGRA
jgi:hypothetical protein